MAPRVWASLSISALWACASPQPTTKHLLEISKAHQNYELEHFYGASADFVEKFADHEAVDKVRYDWAVQLLTEHPNRPQSSQAQKARELLLEVSENARKESNRFMAGLAMMKFAPFEEAREISKQLIKRHSNYEPLDEVYYWLIQDALSRFDVQEAAEYVKALEFKFPQSEQLEGYNPLLRRAEIHGEMFPFPPEMAKHYQGKFVLVDFWSSFCEPCVAALPELRTLRAKLPAENFDIFGISIDDDRAAYDALLAKEKLPWHLIVVGGEPQALAARLGVVMIPTYFVVGPNGRVLSTELDLKDAKATLSGLLEF